MTSSFECLISLPPGMCAAVERKTPRRLKGWSAVSDPLGRKLGSGGGTAYLLAQSWEKSGTGLSFSAWLAAKRKLIIHGGGNSRRLPAYAVQGKPFTPIPVLRESYGQHLDQNILDLQIPEYIRVLDRAPETVVAMVTSGDVLLRFGKELTTFPPVDILALGMRVDPKTASHFGVFFSPLSEQGTVSFFLQKPSENVITDHARRYDFLVDTGMWLFSQRAVDVLMECCGWDADRSLFTAGYPEYYELYAQLGLSLGREAVLKDERITSLSCAIVDLPEPEFYHFGTNRQLIESVCTMQNNSLAGVPRFSVYKHPDQIVQNANFQASIHPVRNHTLWIENADIPASWELTHDHILTGVPRNSWNLRLSPGVCLDCIPIAENSICVRPYGIDDEFKGPLDDSGTTWFGHPFHTWMEKRGIDFKRVFPQSGIDIHDTPLFPVLERESIAGEFIEWLTAEEPALSQKHRELWISSLRLSASEIMERADIESMERQRNANRYQSLAALYRNNVSSVFYRLDLDDTARIFAESEDELPSQHENVTLSPLQKANDHMWRSTVLRYRGSESAEQESSLAFEQLRHSIVQSVANQSARPVCNILSDQIVWARSPVRLDLAGGWTDTPPYCNHFGGKVVNLAVNLNGQPPIQVFAKLSKKHEIVIRSIDLGAEERLTDYCQIKDYSLPGSSFAVVKAALALAGFHPDFQQEMAFPTLKRQLEEFGSGIELSVLAAIPHGSGLGTSSILAATLLGCLNELLRLNWNKDTIITRTLVLEQLMTTGGGWQDQAGGVYRGIKLLQTTPGIQQHPEVRWLPDFLFCDEQSRQLILLYYTGITRLAKNILHEIVRGMFLNESRRLMVLGDIGANADYAANALQRSDFGLLGKAVERSWRLNRQLDEGTNPPEVQKLLAPIGDYCAGFKLLGAGGGGYLLLIAKDEKAALNIRRTLVENPPNARARFVTLSVSSTGLEISRS